MAAAKLSQRKIQRYGWLPDIPDRRDFLFAPNPGALRKLATTPHVDLSTQTAMPKVWDQGQLGSCTAHAIGAGFAFAHKKAGHRAMTPSRLHLYWHERYIEGTVNEDAGAMIRDGFKVIHEVGCSHESLWPYDIAKFATKPPSAAEADAVKHKSLIYTAVPQTGTAIKACLVGGYPISFGFTVYDSFESPQVANTGVMPMPLHSEGILGGHAVLIVGYDEPTQRFIVRNSWGTEWGLPDKPGYFTMPYLYVLSHTLSSDFWTVSVAS